MKAESSKSTWYGVVFVFLIAQQIIGFVFQPYKLVSVYWIAVTIFTFYLYYKLNIKISKDNIKPFVFFILGVLGSLFNTLVGTQIGYGLSKCFYFFFAFVGLMYISNYRINTNVFIPFFIIMYAFFWGKYYVYDEATRLSLDEELFVQASSNAISMSYNIVLIVYLMVSHFQSENKKWVYLSVALINLFWIILQGSRAGIFVAFLLLIYTIFNAFGSTKEISFRTVIISILGVFLLYRYKEFIFVFIEDRSMQGMESYEENVRYFAQGSFFSNLNTQHFLLGYPRDYEYISGITRTFNSFLDLWARCGVIPFIYLVYCFIIRIIYYKRFSVPVLLLVPFLAYAPFESLWGGTLWDICLFMCLFYSDKEHINMHNLQEKVLK